MTPFTRLTMPIALVLATVGAQGQTQGSVESLAWLSGCWAAEGKDAGSGEFWTAPAGGTLLGLSRTVKGDKTVGFEFMQMRVNPEGKLVFIALPSGQKETVFPAVSQTEAAVVFENPQHDFPQRIRYARQGPDQLIARIEGTRSGGQQRSLDFPMRRTTCDAPRP